MEPNLIEVAQLAKQEDRSEVRIAKLKEIAKAGDDLFFILAGEEVFKNSSKFDNYSSFEKNMGQLIEKARHRHRPEGSASVHLPGYLLNQLKKLLSVDYTPPQTGEDMGGDLIALADYYRSNFFVPSIEMILDLSLCKLVGAVNKLCAKALQKGNRKLTRIKKSTKAKKEQTDKRKVFIIAIYEHGKPIEAGTKLNRVCIIIRKQFEDSRGIKGLWGTIPMDAKKMPTPSIDTIDRWLKEEGIRDRDFKQEGRYWIKQT